MKILVQNNKIDTETIYSISEVSEGYNEYSFDIVSFNKMCETVVISKKDGYGYGMPKQKDFSDDDLLFEAQNKYVRELPLKNKERIQKMHDDIVKVWSNNQPEIPMFDIKNY